MIRSIYYFEYKKLSGEIKFSHIGYNKQLNLSWSIWILLNKAGEIFWKSFVKTDCPYNIGKKVTECLKEMKLILLNVN